MAEPSEGDGGGATGGPALSLVGDASHDPFSLLRPKAKAKGKGKAKAKGPAKSRSQPKAKATGKARAKAKSQTKGILRWLSEGRPILRRSDGSDQLGEGAEDEPGRGAEDQQGGRAEDDKSGSEDQQGGRGEDQQRGGAEDDTSGSEDQPGDGAEDQPSGGAEDDKSGSEDQPSGEAEDQQGRGAEDQQGDGAEDQQGRGAEDQPGGGAEDQPGDGAEDRQGEGAEDQPHDDWWGAWNWRGGNWRGWWPGTDQWAESEAGPQQGQWAEGETGEPAKEKKRKKKKRGKAAQPKKKAKPAEKPIAQGITSAELDIPSTSVDLRCTRCKSRLDPAKAQIVGKSCGSWRCNFCNTRAVQLSRLPAWPGFRDKLKGFAPEEKEEFWKSTHDAGNSDALLQLITKRQVKRKKESTFADKKGQYLPLSWYAAQGFDAKRIEATCKDIVEDEVLGTCYRVVIRSKGSGNLDEFEQEEELSAQETAHQGAASSSGIHQGSPSPSGAGLEPGANPSGKLSSVAVKKEQGVATRILAKLAMLITPLAATLKSKHCSKLPPFAVDGAKKILDDLKAMEQNAQKVIRGVASLEHSLADCNDLAPRLGFWCSSLI